MEVYFCDPHARVVEPEKWYQPALSSVNKLRRLVDESGVLEDIERGDIVAVKTHFGDRGTTKTLRSVFIRTVVEKIRERGAKPFVTETTGLGMVKLRSTAVGRLTIAEENGYTQQTLNAPIIIADGLLGYDEVEVEVDGRYLRKVYVAKAIAEADFVVCCTHFKLHMQAGIGGSLKNVGVGCVAKKSKFDLHISGYPVINDRCDGCGECVKICPSGAIVKGEKMRVVESKCVKCTGCYEVCERDAVELKWLVGKDVGFRIVDCAAGVLKTNKRFSYLNFLIDVTPHCDCHPFSDVPVVPDLGILASKDVVAIDQASVDLYLASEVTNPILGNHRFWEWTDPLAMLEYAEEMGLGRRKYRLIEI